MMGRLGAPTIIPTLTAFFFKVRQLMDHSMDKHHSRANLRGPSTVPAWGADTAVFGGARRRHQYVLPALFVQVRPPPATTELR